MFRPASRLISRSSVARTFQHKVAPAVPGRRFLGTKSPVDNPRSWKSSAVRWGLAGAVVYYYNTSNVFAEEPRYASASQIPETDEESEILPTIEALAQERQQRKAAVAPTTATADATEAGQEVSGGIGGLEEEADQQGAFNPETGEINWDCPCLGGMATGPCGEEFKAAFSCFVYSTEDPKGMDCIDKFKGMQDCFRSYPEVYGSELEDDEDDVTADGGEKTIPTEAYTASSTEAPSPSTHSDTHARAEKVSDKSSTDHTLEHEAPSKKERVQAATEQVKKEHEALSESESVVPKAWHDTETANDKK